MQTSQQFVAAVNHSSLGVMLATTQATMAATEQMVRLQMESSKSLLQESFAQTRKLTSLKDFAAVPDMMSAWSKDGLDKLSGYSRNYVAIAQDAQRQVTKAMDENSATFRREFLESAEQAVLHSPVPGAEGLLGGMKLALTFATTAMDAYNQMTHQVTEIAEAGLKSTSLGADVISAPSRKRAS